MINEDTAADGPKDGQSRGYNTSGRPVAFDEITDPNWTRDMLVSDLLTVEIDQAFYYCFRLDINEPGQDQALLSLDTIQIYVSDTPSQTTATVGSLGAIVYDLDDGPDGDVCLRLDARLRDGGAPGSGTGDMIMFVPVWNEPGDYLYLYSEFGLQAGLKQDDIGEQAGFEEWAPCVIPEPNTALLVGLSLLSFGGVLRRRR